VKPRAYEHRTWRASDAVVACLLAAANPWVGLAACALVLGLWGKRATRLAAGILLVAALSPLAQTVAGLWF